MSSLGEHSGQNVIDEDNECAYDSDYGVSSYYSSDGSTVSETGSDYEPKPKKSKSETGSRIDLEPEDIPWRRDQTLRRLDSTLTLSESTTGQTKGSGPFFWIAVSDLLSHCEKTHGGEGYESVQQEISRFRHTKSWKYWLCYFCNRICHSERAHNSHLQAMHARRFDVLEDLYQMLPSQDNPSWRPFVGPDVVKSKPCLEDSITMDETCDHFLVDSTNFHHMPSADEPTKAKCEQYMEKFNAFHDQLSSVRSSLLLRRKYCRDLEVVNTIEPMLFNGDHPLMVLVSRLYKLSSTEQIISKTQQLQFKFLSQLLDRAHGKTSGLISNIAVSKAFEDMRHEIIRELDQIDEKNKGAYHQIVLWKHNLSEFCIGDHRMEIVPAVRTFLHARFDFNSLRVLGCDKMEDLFSSLNRFSVVPKADSFTVSVKSSGNVIINTRRNKSSWGFAFIRCSLDFVGLWSYPGGKVDITGNFKFGGSLTWRPGPYKGSVSVTPSDRDAYAIMNEWGLELETDLVRAIGYKLFDLKDEFFMMCRK